MENSEILKLPYIMPSQAQKHVTHNEALRMLDALIQLSVKSGTLEDAPASPAPGDRYLIPAGSSGLWQNKTDQIAAFLDGAWQYFIPNIGWQCFVQDSSKFLYWDAAWIEPAIDPRQNNLEFVGINGTADTSNRLSVSSDSTVFSHDGADHRLAINKAEANATASLVFQNDWSGRAEFGLAGSENLSLKVSDNGQNWTESFIVEKSSGNIGFGAEPAERLHVLGGNLRVGFNLLNANETVGGPSMKLQAEASGDRPSFFDFFSCDDYGSGYSMRVLRHAGKDGISQITNRGDGGFEFRCLSAAPYKFKADNKEHLRITGDGKVGIGTSQPTADCHINGVMRLEPKTLSTLPSAVTSGAGSLAMVAENGVTSLKLSDGVNWINVG